MTHADPAPPAVDFLTQARAAIASMPPQMQEACRAVQLRIADWPEPDMLRDLGMDDPAELTGLYEGIPLPHKSASFPQLAPDTVWLFRQPILAEWRSRGDVSLERLIAHVTIHEFAHHFGWTDAQIAEIDRWWE